MASNNNNTKAVPEAKAALNQMLRTKTEVPQV